MPSHDPLPRGGTVIHGSPALDACIRHLQAASQTLHDARSDLELSCALRIQADALSDLLENLLGCQEVLRNRP